RVAVANVDERFADARLDSRKKIELALRGLSAVDEVVANDGRGGGGERARGALRRIARVLRDAVFGDFFGARELEAVQLRRDLEERAFVHREGVELERVADDLVLQLQAPGAALLRGDFAELAERRRREAADVECAAVHGRAQRLAFEHEL